MNGTQKMYFCPRTIIHVQYIYPRRESSPLLLRLIDSIPLNKKQRHQHISTMKLMTTVVTFGAAFKVAAKDIVTLGTRPYYLVDEMKPSGLRDKLGENYKR